MKHKILLGMTGSVASILYKKLIEQLQTIGDVDVILTASANHFVNDLSLPKLLKGGKLYQELNEWQWEVDGGVVTEWKKDYPVLHIELRNNHSAFVIAPCSMNTLAKLANGMCDNLLTSVARAWDLNRPMIIAPAANTTMYNHPITEKHMETYRSFSENNYIVYPQSKMLACGTEGLGAMADISKIVEATKSSLQWRFPMGLYSWREKKCSGIPKGNHPGAFGVKRKHSHHTGIDLYTAENTAVLAVEDGTIVDIEPFTGPKDNSPWWNDTDCILIEGASGVVCYGEITPYGMNVSVGKKIKKGTLIGHVKRVIQQGKEHPEIEGWFPSMLHLELYPHGNYKPSNGYEKDKDILIDPTPYLLNSINCPSKILTHEN